MGDQYYFYRYCIFQSDRYPKNTDTNKDKKNYTYRSPSLVWTSRNEKVRPATATHHTPLNCARIYSGYTHTRAIHTHILRLYTHILRLYTHILRLYTHSGYTHTQAIHTLRLYTYLHNSPPLSVPGRRFPYINDNYVNTNGREWVGLHVLH